MKLLIEIGIQKFIPVLLLLIFIQGQAASSEVNQTATGFDRKELKVKQEGAHLQRESDIKTEADFNSETNVNEKTAVLTQVLSSNNENRESVKSIEKPQKKNDTLSTVRKNVTSGLVEGISWIDNFFADDNFKNEAVDLRLDIRQSFQFEESLDDEYKTRVSARVRLPHASRRISLIFRGDDELDDEDGKTSLVDSFNESNSNPSLGIQYFRVSRPGYDQRLTFGYRFGESSYYTGFRIRAGKDLSDVWQTRVSQRLRFYKQHGWENNSIIDFNRIVGFHEAFRQRIHWNWREEDKTEIGHKFIVSSAYTLPLSEARAMQFSWSSTYHTEPRDRWYETELAVSYREQFWHSWMFYEVKPFVSWGEETAWRDNYGLRLSINMIFEKDN